MIAIMLVNYGFEGGQLVRRSQALKVLGCETLIFTKKFFVKQPATCADEQPNRQRQ